MKICMVLTGSLRRSLLREGFEDYARRIRRYASLDVLEIRGSPMGRKAPRRASGLRDEAGRIRRRLMGGRYYTVALSNERAARAMDSEGLARFLRERLASSLDLAFLIGGPYGLDGGLLEEADMTLSLSPMTLPHEMAALVLAEQVYRAFTILRGEPYSH